MKVNDVRRGFTYIEVLVSSVVLGLALAVITSVTTFSGASNAHANLKLQAAQYARQGMDGLKNAVRWDTSMASPMPFDGGVHNVALPGGDFSAYRTGSCLYVVTLGQPLSTMRSVDMVVSWNDFGY